MLQLDGKVGVIVLTNADDANPGGIATQLMNTVGEAVAKASAPAPSRDADVGSGLVALRRAVSRPRRRVAGDRAEQAAGRHHARTRRTLDNPMQLEPIGNGQFRYTAPTGGGPVGEIVRFVEEGGRVVRMITGDSYVERVQ